MTDYTEGYIKIWRKLLDWRWSDNPFMVALFVYCVIRANWKDTEWHEVELKRGEFMTSYNKLANATGLSVKQVRIYLKKLEDTGEIRARSGQGSNHTIIRVCKYNEYQEGHTEGILRAQQGQTEGTLGATDNKYKEYKELKEECVVGEADTPTRTISSSQSKPSLDDVKAFVSDKKLKVSPERFFYYYEARDWKDRSGQEITNWKMALMGWNAMPTHEEQVAGSDDGWLE